MMSTEELCSIAGLAHSLHERLALNQGQATPLDDAQRCLAEQRLTLWRQAAANGGTVSFGQRLEWLGAGPQAVKDALARAPALTPDRLPAWAWGIKAISEEAANGNGNGNGNDQTGEAGSFHPFSSGDLAFPVQADDPLPFETLFFPVLRVARQQIREKLLPLTANQSPDLPPLSALVSDAAYLQAERLLLAQLCELSGNTLGLAFTDIRPLELTLLPLLFGELAELTPDEKTYVYYQQFVHGQLEDGLSGLLRAYPVWGRLMVTLVTHWVGFFSEFFARWHQDRGLINQRAGGEGLVECDTISRISGGVSDPHKQGRSVLLLACASGARLVYKPRSLSSDIAYNSLLHWCNGEPGLSLAFKTLRVIDRRDYGWVLDFVTPEPCETALQAQNFYRRAGMLLCLAYALGATDLHSENLIAVGEHPVIIDTETLMHPKTNMAVAFDHDDEGSLSDSVLRTGLLPHWEFSGDFAHAYDVSGLGRIEWQQAPWQILRWRNMNCDQMVLAPESAILPPHHNVPSLEGKKLSADDYLPFLCAGFGEFYRFLLARRGALLAQRPLRQLMSQQSIRFLFRPTEVYGALLKKSALPQCLRDGVLRSIELDVASQLYWIATLPEGAAAVLRGELDALHQLDVPYFSCRADKNILLIDADHSLAQFFEQDSHGACIERINGLNQGDLDHQLALIQGTFHARQARAYSSSANDTGGIVQDDPGSATATAPEPARWIEEAGKIAERLAQTAIPGAADSMRWLGLNYVARAQRFQFQTLGHALYDGNLGVALFLSAFGAATGKRQYSSLVDQSMRTLRDALRTGDARGRTRFCQKLGIGGAQGLGSIVYGLCLIATFSGQSQWLEDAGLAARLIDGDLISSANLVDIMDGLAGALLGLLKLYQLNHDRGVLQQCVQCGERLLQLQEKGVDRPAAWLSLGTTPLTGFSHGSAGIVYALLQLNRFAPDSRWASAAQSGIDYERHCYLPDHGNWPDHRQSHAAEDAKCAMSWCHGAPGIVLARLGILASQPMHGIEQEIENGLQTLIRQPLAAVDHLCCGNLGLIEVLHLAGRQLQRPHLQTLALTRTAQMLRRSERLGGYSLVANIGVGVGNPGFFQGTSGIAYGLLRLAFPEKLPNVLLWQ